MSEEEVKQVVEHGKRHLEYCMELYNIHMVNGLYFLHGYPAQAIGLKHECVLKIRRRKVVQVVGGRMCELGIQVKINSLEESTGGKTIFMTNSDEIARQLKKICKEYHSQVQARDQAKGGASQSERKRTQRSFTEKS